jgi:ferredoxin
MSYVISIDQGRCIGAGNCVHIAPKTFQLDEENVAYLVDPTAETDEAILDAGKSCPTDAIYLDTQDGQPVYP